VAPTTRGDEPNHDGTLPFRRKLPHNSARGGKQGKQPLVSGQQPLVPGRFTHLAAGRPLRARRARQEKEEEEEEDYEWNTRVVVVEMRRDGLRRHDGWIRAPVWPLPPRVSESRHAIPLVGQRRRTQASKQGECFEFAAPEAPDARSHGPHTDRTGMH
jgi:hypothetical protein